MMLVALIAVVLVPFAVFWWAGRQIEPLGDGPQENAERPGPVASAPR